MLIPIIRVKEYSAHGGPAKEFKAQDGYSATPTRNGRFVIYSISKHVSYGKYSTFSGIAWGTPIKLEGNMIYIKNNGSWKPITTINSTWKKDYDSNMLQFIKNYAHELGYTQFPDTWIFNDFGHISVKYYKDANGNNRLDKNESLIGDFIHTTPFDEATTHFNKLNHINERINLPESHGCIHVKPDDIDEMISKGFLKAGNIIQVHKYDEMSIPERINIDKRVSQYEAHFFPGQFKMIIYKAPFK